MINMKKHLIIPSNVLIYLILLVLMLWGLPATQTIAQGPKPAPLQLDSRLESGQFAPFFGADDDGCGDAPGCSQLLMNPGFEDGGWSPWETFGSPELDTNIKYGGNQSAHLGIDNNASDQIVQTVAVPANANLITIDFWYRLATEESNAEVDFFCYGLWDQSGSTALVVRCLDLGVLGDQEWNQESYSLTSAEQATVAGQTVLMAFILQSNASAPSQAWVDDTALLITAAGAGSDYHVYLPLVISGQSRPSSPPPVIVNFSADPDTIAPGGSSVLHWQVSGATSISISPNVGPVNGTSISVSPSETTLYSLTASNAAGSTTAQTTVTVTNGGGGDTATFWLPYESGSGELLPTYGTSVAVDNTGGMHVGYAIYSGLDNGQRPAYYAYCPANCDSPAGWSRIRLSDYVQDVRLALDPTGHPRMLFYTTDNPDLPENNHEYQYAVCDNNCTNSANWTITAVANVSEIPGGRSYQNNRYFALDLQGRPAFVFSQGEGIVYAYCNQACTNAANWGGLVVVSNQWPSRLALAFTPAGDPRILIDYYDSENIRTRLLFIGCETIACDNSRGRFLVTNTANGYPASIGGEADFSMKIDTNGQPRIALFTGDTVTPPLELTALHYLWCNTDCLNPDADTWNLVRLANVPVYQGDGVDLVLDPANRPRLAYQMADEGLGYAWCNGNCESASNWQTEALETTAVIMEQYPPQLPQHERCPILTWFNGVRPSLALDSGGNPRLGYDAELWWGGTDPFVRCDIDVPLARFGFFQQP